jgi:hypothetical protein
MAGAISKIENPDKIKNREGKKDVLLTSAFGNSCRGLFKRHTPRNSLQLLLAQ